MTSAVVSAVAALSLVLASLSSPGPRTGAPPLPGRPLLPAGTLAASAGLAPKGTERPASRAPWGRVGPGWFVALWGPHAAFDGAPPPAGWQDQTTTVYLVDPVGGRYRVARLPAPSYYQLLDWSGDGRRALLATPPTGPAGRFFVEDLDLTTGRVLHRFSASSSAASFQYTRPHGLAILASSTGAGGEGSVDRLGLSGALQLAYPRRYPGAGALAPGMESGTGGVLPSLDGTELVLEAKEGMVLVANDGAFVRDVGPGGQSCSPERWWDATEVVASCVPLSSSPEEPSLWLVPITGRTASRLTDPQPPDYGDLDGWEVGGALYTQAAGACGTEFLARRQPDGRTAPVAVPGAKYDVHVVGAFGPRLALQAKLGCGEGPSLFWFNPVTGAEAPLLGPPVNSGNVLAALPFPGLEP